MTENAQEGFAAMAVVAAVAAAATAAVEVAVEVAVAVAAVPLKGRCCCIAVAEKMN